MLILDINLPPAKIIEVAKNTMFYKLLVIDKTIDNIIGVVSVNEILKQYIAKNTIQLSKIISDLLLFRNKCWL